MQQLVRNVFVCLVITFALVAGANAWVRPSPERAMIADGVNIERVAATYSVQSIGQISVFIPLDEGGTGNRMIVEGFALFIYPGSCISPCSTRMELYRAWGENAQLWLDTKRKALELAASVELFGMPGYTPLELPQ
jgi:hypothetical protein